MVRRPRILVTLDTGESIRKGVSFPALNLKAAYARSVELAGGTPVLAAPTNDVAVIEDLAALMDGLVVTGGAFDIDPARYGATNSANVRVDATKPLRTSFEEALLARAFARNVPVLGICGGMQLLNVVRGGTLVLDIRSQVPRALEHEQPSSPALPHHAVAIARETALHRLLGADSIDVNSTHHQSVAKLGDALAVLGTSSDGVIEAIGAKDDLAILGVQWHPELLDDAVSRALYGAHVREAASRR